MAQKSVGQRVAAKLLRDWEERSAGRMSARLGLSVFQRVHNVVFAANAGVIGWFCFHAFVMGHGWLPAGWFFVGFFASTMLDAFVVCGEDWLLEISREQHAQDSQKNRTNDLAPVVADFGDDGAGRKG